MKLCLFDGRAHKDLLPLTYTRPVSDVRIGIYTIKQKWEKAWRDEVGIHTLSYLSEKFNNIEQGKMIFLSAAIFPSKELVSTLENLEEGQKVISNGRTLAFASAWENYNECAIDQFEEIEMKSGVNFLSNPGDVFEMCEREIINDIQSLSIQPTHNWVNNTVFGDQLYKHESAKAKACIFNSETGPIYIGENAEVLEGSIIRGPFVLGKGSVVKMAAKIYGATSIGPYCKVGGELSNVVIQGYSNKGHDGFLGNSVIGEWCNLGADTNTSNLKNNYGEVKTWNYEKEEFLGVGRTFQGLVMGDHSKTGINTMLNTGTTVGVCANIFGGGFPPKFIPSFSWGPGDEFKLEKAFEVADRMMKRRNINFTEKDKVIFGHVFKLSNKYRT